MINRKAVILTPIATGSVVPPLDLGYPRVFSECQSVSYCREVDINANRSRLQRIYNSRLAGEFPFVFLIDSDVVVTKSDLDRLFDAWKPGTTPCVNTKGTLEGHVVTSCCLVDGATYGFIDYMSRPRECQCLKLPNPFYVEGLVGSEVE